jgi:hypothetical protein
VHGQSLEAIERNNERSPHGGFWTPSTSTLEN